MSFSLFIDFDGTIAVDDVGRRFFTIYSHGRNIPLVERWARREISSIECLREEIKLVDVRESELAEFVTQFDIDPWFPDLYGLCLSNDIPCYVVSDGLDIYIEQIMRQHGFAEVPVLANRAIFRNGRLEVEFPYAADSCGHCGNCKGAAIRRLLRKGDRSIFVGDGYSDLCAVDVADYLFAKGDLAEYLRELGKEFMGFDKLEDVVNQVRRIIGEAT